MDSSGVCSPSKHVVNFEAYLFSHYTDGSMDFFLFCLFYFPLCSISLS